MNGVTHLWTVPVVDPASITHRQGNRASLLAPLPCLHGGCAAPLRSRHIARHFRRLALLDAFTDTTVSREVPASLAQTLVAASNSDAEALLAQLGSHADGLSESRSREIRASVGLNEVEHEQPLPWWTAPVALLQQPVQPAADAAGGHLVADRRHQGRDGDFLDGGAVDAAALLAGKQIQPGRRRAEGDGQQHRDGAAPRLRKSCAAAVLR